jgi:hypothetical protein
VWGFCEFFNKSKFIKKIEYVCMHLLLQFRVWRFYLFLILGGLEPSLSW